MRLFVPALILFTTLAHVAPRIFEIYVQNLIVQRVQVSVIYNSGGTQEQGLTLVSNDGLGWIDVCLPEAFDGSFEIKGNHGKLTTLHVLGTIELPTVFNGCTR